MLVSQKQSCRQCKFGTQNYHEQNEPCYFYAKGSVLRVTGVHNNHDMKCATNDLQVANFETQLKCDPANCKDLQSQKSLTRLANGNDMILCW